MTCLLPSGAVRYAFHHAADDVKRCACAGPLLINLGAFVEVNDGAHSGETGALVIREQLTALAG
jgi:hypothetical protein